VAPDAAASTPGPASAEDLEVPRPLRLLLTAGWSLTAGDRLELDAVEAGDGQRRLAVSQQLAEQGLGELLGLLVRGVGVLGHDAVALGGADRLQPAVARILSMLGVDQVLTVRDQAEAAGT
jgi:hypothetical protein